MIEDLGEKSLLALVGQVVDAQRGHHRVERRGDRRRPFAGRHVELDVAVAPGERPHLGLARPHHPGGKVGEYRGAARVPVQDRARRGPGARAQIQERERLARAEGQQDGHEPPVRHPVPLAVPRLRRPGRGDLSGLPDRRVHVRRGVHEQKATEPLAHQRASPPVA